MTSLLFISGCATQVQFCDPNLEAAIRDAIEYKEAILKYLGGLTQLRASRRNITHLNGLEHCTNLQGLFLSDNQIIDISPLSNMTKLRRLELHANQISNTNSLGNMTILENLCLTGNQIIDISPLNNLTNLRALYLENNQISDITPFSSLTDLRQLYLDHNRITNISPPKVLAIAGSTLNQLNNPEAIEAFCDCLMAHRDSKLLQIALDKGYAPKEEAKRALFYFITEQWQQYKLLDFQEGNPLLRKAYAQASEEVKRRFLEVARQNGRSDILSETWLEERSNLGLGRWVMRNGRQLWRA